MTVNPFELRCLGTTPLRVTRLGLGTLALGNLYGAIADPDARDALTHAIDLGIRLVDTAPSYGFGLAEERVGAALATVDRSRWVLSTKVGRLLRAGVPPDPGHFVSGRPIFMGVGAESPVFDFSFEGTLASLSESLDRLGLERVDVVLIHDPDRHFREALEGAYPALERLRADGRVSAIGVGMNQADMLVDFVREADLDCVLVAGRYTLLEQGALARLLPLCGERGVGVIVGGAYNTGILANPDAAPSDLSGGATYNHLPVLADVRERVAQLRAICERHGVPLKAAAAQFPFGHPSVTSVLMGVRSRAELDDNLDMLGCPIPAQLWADLRDHGLLDPEAPLPTEPSVRART